MAKKYLDDTGLSTLVNKIGTKYQQKLTAGTNISIDANNVISALGGGGGSSPMDIKFVTIDKTSSAIAGSGTVTAAPSYSQDVCNVQAPVGSKFYVFSFTRIMNYKQHSTVTGQMKLQLKINNVVQQEVVNQKVKAAIGELLVAEYQATGNNDLISLDLTSLSNNSYASFCSNTTIIVGENITVTEITQQS